MYINLIYVSVNIIKILQVCMYVCTYVYILFVFCSEYTVLCIGQISVYTVIVYNVLCVCDAVYIIICTYVSI